MEEKLVMMGDGGRWPWYYCRVDVLRAREWMSRLNDEHSEVTYWIIEYDARRCRAARLRSCLREVVEAGERFTRKEARASRPSVGPP
jgi:hypothetical protein